MRVALDILVGVVGLLMLVLGVQWLTDPVAMAEPLGITLQGADAFSTARGDVAGMFIGGALMALLGLLTRNSTWLLALALLLALIAAGRVVGFFLDGPATPSIQAFIAELLMAAVLVLKATQAPAPGATETVPDAGVPDASEPLSGQTS